MTTYAIGDVQGCYRSLLALLRLIQFQPNRDSLWFCGDLVNRGPHSLEVLRFIAQLPHKRVVLGNHDFHLLAKAATLSQVSTSAADTLHAVLTAADRDELLTWLRMQPLCYHEHGYYLVHAGIYPLWSLIQAQNYAREVERVLQGSRYLQLFEHMYGDQPACWNESLSGWDRLRFIINAFTRMRFINLAGQLELKYKGIVGKQPPEYLPWFEHPQIKLGSEHIIFGHWAALQGQTTRPNVIGLDTGCIWGGQLTALRLEDRQRFSVAAREK